MGRVIALLTVLSICAGYAQTSKNCDCTREAVVLVDVDAQGKVSHVKIFESSGDARFDEAALRRFKDWEFKPGKPRQIKVPVTFTMPPANY